MSKRTARQLLGITARGLAMGAADVVPGVSGGTIAFITGIYEELLETLSNLSIDTLTGLFRDGIKATWKAINGNFLLSLFGGILISIFSLAKLIEYLLVAHPHLLWAFFFGLVAASIIYVGKQVGQWNLQTIVSLLVGSAVAFWITLLPPMGNVSDWWYLLICGSIAICAMILPGISGSFILLLLGAYPTVISAVSDRDFSILSIFALGCVIGLMLFSRMLNWMFKHVKNVTIAVLTGFLIGSMNKLWPWKVNVGDSPIMTHSDGRQDWLQNNVMPADFPTEPQIVGVVLLALLGFALIFIMERFASSTQP